MPFFTLLFEQKVNARQEEEEEGGKEGRGRWWWSHSYIFLPRASYSSKHLTYNSSFNSITINNHAAAAAKSLQSCLTLCDPIDDSPPSSPIPGILPARILEWVAISSSNTWKWKVKVKLLSCIWLVVILWTAAYQAPPSMGFSRQEYWSGVPLPSLATCAATEKSSKQTEARKK